MKHLKLFALLAIAAATLTGCTKEYYGAQVFTHEYRIVPNDWKRIEGELLPGSNNYLYAAFANSDITPYVVANGSVTADVWAIYDVGENKGSWHPLPYVYPCEVQVSYSDGTTGIEVIPETIRMEWEEGIVTFIIQDLHGEDPEAMINSITVRVTVTSNM